MAYTIKNNLSQPLKIISFLWSDTIPAGTWHTGDKTSLSGGDFDIHLEVVSGYLLEFIMNPTLINTTVSKDKETVIDVSLGEIRGDTATILLRITDKSGRNERQE